MAAIAAEVFPSGSQELHVLAVDDSLVDRKVIERLLKLSSCKVTAVDSGSRALQYLGLDGDEGSLGFNELKVNLIMTDYSMPGMTGYELLKRIKESSAFREVPVVVMSSENIMTRIDRCLEEGAEDFLVKPVRLSDVTRLKDCLMRRKAEKTERRVDKRKLETESDCSYSCSCSGQTQSQSSSAAESATSTPSSSATSDVYQFTSESQSPPSSSLEVSSKRPKLETEG